MVRKGDPNSTVPPTSSSRTATATTTFRSTATATTSASSTETATASSSSTATATTPGTTEAGTTEAGTAAPTTARPPVATTTSTGPATQPAPTPAAPPAGPRCTERSGRGYALDWRAQGRTFFDDWEFLRDDYNNGASEYLPREVALADGVAQAHDTHAILRTGTRGLHFKRRTAKIITRRAWNHSLMVIRHTHTPWGCGLWPAIWTHAPGYPWPTGGELDILEYVNDFPSMTSFHTGLENRCRLDGGQINKPGCQVMPDLNGMNYNCHTQYPLTLGCAVNKLPLWSPYEWAHQPGVIAVEWTERFVKVFVIPENEIPADLQSDSPRPDSWERWMVSYYPFALSEERFPGSCPNPHRVMRPQQLVMNIGMCGDWASKVWPISGSCVNRMGPRFPQQCLAVDPLLNRDPNATKRDCCTQFIWDADGRYGTDEYLAQRAFFNISWVKVYNPRP